MRFGISTIDITPPFPTKMAGYGGRLDYYDDVHDPLTFTALVLEERGKRAFLGAADLLWFDDTHATRLREKVAKAIDAPVDNVMLNASHTHAGPLVLDSPNYFPIPMGSAARYREWFGEQALEAANQAAASLEPGALWFGQGKTSVPMNRRLERDGKILLAPNPEGPVDDRLQVLMLRDQHDAMRAVLIRVSCHPVSTGAQHRLSAEYPGAFRAAFRRAFGPQVVPVFLQGVGGDARPSRVADGDRWRVMPHDELSHIGDDLLRETLAVLTSGKMEKLGRLALRGRLNVANVPCEVRYTKRAQFEELLAKSSGLQRSYAQAALRQLDAGEPLPSDAPVRVHTLWLTGEMAFVGIQGEVLMGLGAYVERSLAPKRTLLLGYCNGAGGYLPDSKELARGGYEATSYLENVWTGPFKPGIEKAIAAAVWRR